MEKKTYLSKVLLGLILVASCLSIVGCIKQDNKKEMEVQTEYNKDKNEFDNIDDNSHKKNENIGSEDEIKEMGAISKGESDTPKEVSIYYIDEMTGEVTGKTVTIRTANDIWGVLQKTGILTDDCQLLSCRVNEAAHTIDLDFNAATGNRIRSMGTTGEIQIIGCIINTYLEAYDCDGIKLTEEGKALQTSHGANYEGYSGIVSF